MNIWSNRPAIFADIAALLLGALLTLAFAPYQVFPLAILAPAGLLALWLNATPKRALWLGFLFGVGLFSTGIYWIFISIHQFGDVPSLIAGLITAGLVAVLALFFFASSGYIFKRYFPQPTPATLIAAFPAVWIFLSEWTRSWLFSGFPWLFIGYSQTNSPLRGYAAIFGVYGVSLAVLLTSGLLVNSFKQYKQKNYQAIYASLLTALAIWVTGGILNLITWTQPDGKSISVSLVQGNIPQELKWSPDHLQLSFDRYTELTNPLWGKSDLIIWPEAAIPLTMQEAAGFINSLDEKAQKTKTQLILGIPVQAINGTDYHNAIIMLGKDRGIYLKRLLVPFGEYVPFQRLAAGLFDLLHVPMSNLSPGNFHQPMLHVNGITILPSICFEITFPDLMRSNDSSIDMLLTITNDAWFGDSSAQAQHLQMAAMRAIEFNRPVLFASNDGITAIIDNHGMVTSSAPTHEATVLKANIQPMTGLTPWMYVGSDSVLFILLCMLFAATRSQKSARAAIELKNLSTNEI